VHRADAVRSSRLELVVLDPMLLDVFVQRRLDVAERALTALVEPDWPDDHDEAFLRMRRREHADAPDPWGVRAIVRRHAPRRMIGHAGFHGGPGENALELPAAVELGYTVFPAYQGKGYASEATEALIAWAAATWGVTQFVVSVSPTNGPSLAIARKLGFSYVRDREDDEDGLEQVFLLER
jgi:RimJ/RimL family protein N-acetyltransferase